MKPLRSLPTFILALAAFHQPSFGQASTPSLVGFGYRLPADSITAAPGQVLLVSIRGIQPLSPGAASPSQASAVAAEVVQAGETIPVSIQGLRQTRCAEPPATAGCQPVTNLLVQIPQGFRNLSVLRIRDRSAVVSEIVLRRVEDAIHILSSCDELRAVGGPVEDGPSPAPAAAASCRAASGGGGRYEDPARSGDTLFLWAYGLGEVDRPYPDNAPHQPELFPRATQPLTINFDFVGAGPLSERRITGLVPAYAAMISRDGLYQINFVVPPVPAGTPPCSAAAGDFNATITIVGTDSADAARICVAP